MLERVVTKAITVVRALSLSNVQPLIAHIGDRQRFMEGYVLFFAALLTVIVNIALRGPVACSAVALYRIVDIVSYRLWFLLVKSKTQPWDVTTLRRSLLIGFINAYELVVAFATLYLTSGEVRNGQSVLHDPMSAVYFSTVTMLTVGFGDFVPLGGYAKLLVCAQLVSGLIMLAFVFPALVSVFGSSPRGNHERE